MRHIYFLVNWYKDKTKTWSGTCWGLYQALQKYYEVEDIDCVRSKTVSVTKRVFRRLGLLRHDMERKDILAIRKQLRRRFENMQECVVIQFKEYVPTDKNVRSYIYQDLTVSYVREMATSLPMVFKKSGYKNYSMAAIDKKVLLETDNQQTCAGVFCMGRWLCEYLVNTIGLPSAKVHAVGGGGKSGY